ncbi:hypothetical protein M409DRAFT_57151 [Zasmidium cellare ATCC 36951]|uniref:Uncharacterized protein n=1 Tax=Zasmidium cellare ATCC 36951 TaxID=1080233 RepID=A0A6A6CDZ4_ZASCE|nr:uncharacterized protein M409DRAFT_57151 [Zasmidium cellare ATCC 36951]KAF2163646.1 hypothetical protein M409DRAFT_57151 [Zasmidium cellare ATCC 36951]
MAQSILPCSSSVKTTSYLEVFHHEPRRGLPTCAEIFLARPWMVDLVPLFSAHPFACNPSTSLGVRCAVGGGGSMMRCTGGACTDQFFGAHQVSNGRRALALDGTCTVRLDCCSLARVDGDRTTGGSREASSSFRLDRQESRLIVVKSDGEANRSLPGNRTTLRARE